MTAGDQHEQELHIIRRLLAGDSDAYEELVKRYERPIINYVYRLVQNVDEAMDVAQEVFVKAYYALDKYDDTWRFSTWLYRIALNVSISFARGDGLRRGHAVPLDEDAHELADTTATDPARELQVRALQAFIAALPPLDRALLLLYLEDRGYREIADILGISQTNVSTRISRLKQRIRNEL